MTTRFLAATSQTQVLRWFGRSCVNRSLELAWLPLHRLTNTFDVFLSWARTARPTNSAAAGALEATGPSARPAPISSNRVHRLGPYDLQVDTTAGVTSALARELIRAWVTGRGRSALFVDAQESP